MKLVDSRTQQLDYGQILHVYHGNEKQEDKRLDDFKVWMLATGAAIAKMNADGFIIGNTFFLYRRGPKGKEHQAIFWAMNADTLQNMVDNVAECITQIVGMGITELISIYKGPATTRVIRQAFRKISSPNDDLRFSKSENGSIVMRMDLSGDDNV